MEKTLKLLIELQQIDTRLLELEKAKGNLPDEVNNFKKKLAKIVDDLAKKEESAQSFGQEKRRCELEIKTLEDQLVKYRNQIYAVKNNKEYDAITAEIETTEIEISDLETSQLEAMEAEEKLKPELEALRQSKVEIEVTISEKETELTQLIKATEDELEALSEQRKALAAQVYRPVLASYDRVRKAKNGIGVVPIKNGTCTGCFTNLPPQTTLEIKKMNQAINCQYCGRFLVYINNSDDGNGESSEDE